MAAFWMSELTSTEVEDSNRFLTTSQQAAIRDGVRQVGRTSTSRRGLRVLVVDHEQSSSRAFARLMNCWGHAPRATCDGRAALRMAAAQHPDVVLLMNLELPFLEACRIASQLRRDFSRKECLIIGVTGQADDERRQQCHEAGIDVVFVPPIDPEVLEMLLLLECVHVNRRQTNSMASFGTPGSSPLARQKPRANAGKLPLRRRTLAWRRVVGADSIPWNRQEAGGWSC